MAKVHPSRPMCSTPMQRTHKRIAPLTPAELEQERAREKERQKWDKSYITAAQAEKIPQEALDAQPGLKERIQYSQPDWPENRMAASTALKDAPAGAGETVEKRDVLTKDLFTGQKMGSGE